MKNFVIKTLFQQGKFCLQTCVRLFAKNEMLSWYCIHGVNFMTVGLILKMSILEYYNKNSLNLGTVMRSLVTVHLER